MSAPVIFCHYGNSNYLPYVFETVRLTNPDKDIFLLGDKDNKWLESAKNIKHCFFNEYQYGAEIETFDQVYRLVQGKKHGNIRAGKDWVNFVFKRWFYIHNFLTSQGIGNFWHFDSDNMILDSLSHHERKFQPYDCTEQCNGNCMNGYISSPLVVLKYINKTNELFQNNEYLREQQVEFDERNENFAFTEMRAYKEFKEDKESSINSIKLRTIIDGSTFDDSICREHNMVMECLPSGKKIKKVHCSPDGKFYCYEKTSSNFVKMNSLNLSWVPVEFFQIVLTQVKKQLNKQINAKPNILQMPTLCEIYKRQQHLPWIALIKLKAILKKVKQLTNRFA